jgi:hypothetical protein
MATPALRSAVSSSSLPSWGSAERTSLAQRVERTLTSQIALTPVTRRLLPLVDDPHFYDVLATLDRAHASDWREMAKVQRAFHKAEPSFDKTTRRYSEHMRLTLHAAVLLHIADPSLRGDRSLYEAFLELHPTAFHENGAWFDRMDIPLTGALHVVEATPMSMWKRAGSLLAGAFVTDHATVRAAAIVRASEL